MTLDPKRKWKAIRGEGEAYLWLQAHREHDGAECLIWPFSRHPTGYGSFGYLGKMYYSHRFMCELVHGPAPSSKHQAAHSCGRGHLGCVHPKHLSWKTIKDNLMDRREHGTARANPNGHFGILSAEDVSQIRALRDVMTQSELAALFGVKRPAIQYWLKHDRPRSTMSMTPNAVRKRKWKQSGVAS